MHLVGYITRIKQACVCAYREFTYLSVYTTTQLIAPNIVIIGELMCDKIIKNFSALVFQSQCSFPCSHLPATFPCREADRSCPPRPTVFFKLLFNIILSSPPRSSNQLFSLQFTKQIPVCIPRHPYACYMRDPYHISSFDHPNII